MTILGKRKRRQDLRDPDKSSSSGNDTDDSFKETAKEALRRHFEAQFAPLAVPASNHFSSPELDASEHDDEEFHGLSDSPEESPIDIVEHTTPSSHSPASLPTPHLRSFMSAKSPTHSLPPPSTKKPRVTTSAATVDDPTELAHLQNDLSLQRLLSESHLLAPSLTHSSSTRHAATDIRLQALGAKKSLLAQEKMPMSHRRGIQRKRGEKEEGRRREAKENGVVLERGAGRKKEGVRRKESRDGVRGRDVGAPAVGKLRGGVLRLSGRDVKEIVGRSGGGARGRKVKRGGR
ncbi:MAG: hypothetical protein M1824_004085 [Vezdaea acicularis]|nr:MAG: hypothetical protein M1824_004085 [Vezdaea acicularis]